MSLVTTSNLPSKSDRDFASQFEALTGHRPFPWQESFFHLMLNREFSEISRVSLPTGTGKTSIMTIWLLALAWQAAREEDPRNITIPRRLVWVVNRRVVVDQATREAETLADRLRADNGLKQLSWVRDALKRLCLKESSEDLPAISTLRGHFADNGAWRADPSAPAIIVGTVDMIGSRLLFSGYGCGYKSKPLHAGFLGQDSLLIHDEAHLEPAFQELISAIKAQQEECGEFRPLKIIALTATSRDDRDRAFSLTEADGSDDELSKRIHAGKGIAFYSVADEKNIADKTYERALEFKDSGQAILVFLRKLEDVTKVCEKLHKADLHVQALTGTLRGFERDALADTDDIFARFLPKPNPSIQLREGAVYLVCTSAGEVGIDISADHLICDLTPFDSMAQRFGRVNRYGKSDAQINIVYSTGQEAKKDANANPSYHQACQQALALLQRLAKRADQLNDGSPAALSALLRTLSPAEREGSFTPPPDILPATDILFDAWALTSARQKLPGRPPVADWLHGDAPWEPPETYVAWREEVELVTHEVQELYEPEDLLEDYPLKPHELLRDTTERVFKSLQPIAERAAAAQAAGQPELSVWLVGADGDVEVRPLATFATESKESGMDSLANRTLLLPPSAGGLGKGMLSGSAKFDDAQPYDIADKWRDERGTQRRRRVWDNDSVREGMRLVRKIDLDPEGEEDEARLETRRVWRWYVRPKSADDDGSQVAQREQDLEPHLQEAERFAAAFAGKLLSDAEAARAVTLAAKWHDLGKDRRLWQRSIGNPNYPDKVLAKSGNKMRPIETGKYRHEFGSLLDVQSLLEVEGDPEFRELGPGIKDLLLHFIGSHHGRARPYFPPDEVFDPENPDSRSLAMALEVPRRYARLQRKYGRWGLAYLESLVRAADALASQNKDLRLMHEEASPVAADTAQ